MQVMNDLGPTSGLQQEVTDIETSLMRDLGSLNDQLLAVRRVATTTSQDFYFQEKRINHLDQRMDQAMALIDEQAETIRQLTKCVKFQRRMLNQLQERVYYR
jgi:hypothetical protein